MKKIETSVSIKRSPPLKPFGFISFNYNEISCLHLAWHFLREQCYAERPRSIFRSLPVYELHYLKMWLNQPELMKQLRFDSKQSVRWPIKTLESGRSLKWLALALGLGIPEDTINSVAVDEATIERDMAILTLENHENDNGVNEILMSHFLVFQTYYCQVARLAQVLIKKLTPILKKVAYLSVNDDQAHFLNQLLA